MNQLFYFKVYLTDRMGKKCSDINLTQRPVHFFLNKKQTEMLLELKAYTQEMV